MVCDNLIVRIRMDSKRHLMAECPIRHTLSFLKPMTCNPSIEVARESATYAWPLSNTLLRSTLTRSSAMGQLEQMRHKPTSTTN